MPSQENIFVKHCYPLGWCLFGEYARIPSNPQAHDAIMHTHMTLFFFWSSVPIGLLMGTKKGTDRVYNAAKKPSFGKGKERGKTETFWKALFHQLVERQG